LASSLVELERLADLAGTETHTTLERAVVPADGVVAVTLGLVPGDGARDQAVAVVVGADVIACDDVARGAAAGGRDPVSSDAAKGVGATGRGAAHAVAGRPAVDVSAVAGVGEGRGASRGQADVVAGDDVAGYPGPGQAHAGDALVTGNHVPL